MDQRDQELKGARQAAEHEAESALLAQLQQIEDPVERFIRAMVGRVEMPDGSITAEEWAAVERLIPDEIAHDRHGYRRMWDSVAVGRWFARTANGVVPLDVVGGWVFPQAAAGGPLGVDLFLRKDGLMFEMRRGALGDRAGILRSGLIDMARRLGYSKELP